VITDSAIRPLRADAQRNHDRIIAATHEAFAESGLDTPVEEIARRAGVGAATVYRRFPNREVLLRAIVDARLAELEPALAAALSAEDPWEGLLAALHAILDIQVRNLAFLQVLAQAGAMPHLKSELAERVMAPLYELFARAQAAGELRADLEPAEVHQLIRMVAVTATEGRDCAAGPGWRRYLALLADGLRTPTPSHLPPRASAADGAGPQPCR
jgi:AcrR family transcriptional regulator